MKNRRTKTKIALLMVLALTVGSLYMDGVESLAKVKLNKTSVTIQTGQKYSLKLKGTKKKVTWSSSKKKIASVSAKGVVKGKKAGQTTITAKVGKKKYTCKVVVKATDKNNEPATPTSPAGDSDAKPTDSPVQSAQPNISEEELAENCTVEIEEMPSSQQLLFTVTNHNQQMIDDIEITYTLKDANNMTVYGLIYENNFSLRAIPAGKQAWYIVYLYDYEMDIEFIKIDFDKTEINKKVSVYEYASAVEVSSQINAEISEYLDGVTYKIKNPSGKYMLDVEIVFFFYDSNGKLFDADRVTYSLLPKQIILENGRYVRLNYASMNYTVRAYQWHVS